MELHIHEHGNIDMYLGRWYQVHGNIYICVHGTQNKSMVQCPRRPTAVDLTCVLAHSYPCIQLV